MRRERTQGLRVQLGRVLIRKGTQGREHEMPRFHAISIEQYFRQIDEHLKSRIDATDSYFTSETGNMTETFYSKTSASLLPVMDGTENVTKQLTDSIEFHDALLDDAGKKLLSNYILKT
ncbi:hypothetical protein JTB14_037010 [Gonioctena quinquepunctata]|nr:hypothetical protein JTB14_037010 [Gonioctena quinquepunctata]